MGARRNKTNHTGQPGRPRLLTKEVEDQLVNATAMGVPVSTAAQAAGVSSRTFQVWCARGRDEEDNRADGKAPNPDEQPYLDLWEKILTARAQAATRSVLQIQKVAQGGLVTEETTRKYRDPETGEMVVETSVKRTPPDWRAAAWYLEKQHRQHFGKEPTQVELTGADGGPVALSAGNVEDLADRVAANLKQITAGALLGLPAGASDDDPVDAEIIEDHPGSGPR